MQRPDGTYMVARITTMGMASGQILGHFGGSQHIFTADVYIQPIPLPTPFDFNGDGTVNSIDFNILAAHFGQTTGQTFSTGDFNGDGVTNAMDFNAIAMHYGEHATAPALDSALGATLVPEPASIGMLLASIAM